MSPPRPGLDLRPLDSAVSEGQQARGDLLAVALGTGQTQAGTAQDTQKGFHKQDLGLLGVPLI